MRAWDSRTLTGRLLRWPLRCIPSGTVVPVLSGPNRGRWWTVGSAPHGAWIGTLERDKLAHFVGRISEGMTVWDIGANVGLYTLPAAQAAGSTGHVVAFEPMPRNLRILRRHLALNGCGRVEVCEAAVGDEAGTLRMAEGDSPSEFHAEPAGRWEVRAVTLDSWLEDGATPPPDVVKIDVEGSDDAVLRGGAVAFSKYRPLIYLALHGERQRLASSLLLADWDYRVVSLEADLDPDVSSEWLAEPR